MFQMAGEVVLRIQNLKKGNAITKTMKSGEIVIGDLVIPFVLQRLIMGRVNDIGSEAPLLMDVTYYEQRPSTRFTKQGYGSVSIRCGQNQVFVYIKKEMLQQFFSAFWMDAMLRLSR